MDQKSLLTNNQLYDIFDNPSLQKELREVFAFVETITDQQSVTNELTPTEIENWNKKFDKALKILLSTEGDMTNDKKKKSGGWINYRF